MSYCTQCGNQLPDDATFCNKCGTKQTPNIPVPNPQLKNSHFTLWFVLAVLFCWPAAVIGYLTKRKANNANSDVEAAMYEQKAIKTFQIGVAIVGGLILLSLMFQ